MKKNYWGLLVALLMFLQSCTVDTQVTYHKNQKQSIVMNVDMKELLEEIKKIDSNHVEKKPEVFRFTKDWTNLYDIHVRDGKKVPAHTDSTRLMRKILVKENHANGELTGFSMKIDQITDRDLKFLNRNSDSLEKLYIDEWDWDGENLTIYTKNWTHADGHDIDMIKHRFVLTFEEPIKSIKGKHDWLKKVDSKTIEINLNIKGKEKLRNKDEKIIITAKGK